MIKKIVLAVLLLSASPAVFSQARQVDRDEFWKPWRAALKLFYESPHRKTVKYEYYKEGVLSTSNEWLYEEIKPDRKRYVEIEKSGDRVFKAESIQIGTVKYCRKNDGEWQIVSGSCGTGGGSGGPSNIVSQKYTVDKSKLDGKKVTTWEEYIVYKDTYSPEKDKEKLSYWQTKFWLDKDGLLVREERRKGMLEPLQVTSVTITTYQYDPPGLKIEAPITGPAKPE